MSAPSLSQTGTDVILTWTEPSSNGPAISDYEIQIYDGSLYTEFESTCNGTLQLAAKSCTIPMSFFRSILTLGTQILV